MQSKSTLFLFAAVLTLLAGIFALLASAAAQEILPPETKGVAPKCLACHGPYEKLREKTADYVAPSGETVTPHQYVPHEDKDAKDIPDCTECHVAHPIPLEDKSTVAKPDGVNWCYSSCHHANNLQPCSSCH
jgi:hypothetical protein